MTLADLNASLKDAKRQQHAARLVWRIAAERHPKNDPRIRTPSPRYKRRKPPGSSSTGRSRGSSPTSKSHRRASPSSIAEEGFIPHAYNDPANHATFGVGHLLHLGPVTAADRAEWGTKAKSETARPRGASSARGSRDRYEQAVRESVKKPLKPHQFDALLSMAFNIGTGGFRRSTVVKRLNAGDFRGAADAMLMWNKPARS